MKQSFPSSTKAFTLIELSIVLVGIGLLVGGVLVGKDLIESAKIRGQISQIEQLKTFINVFKSKYNCLAGDCPNAYAFFGSTCGANNISYPNILGCNGNGDGNIDLNGYWWPERGRIWAHLGYAGLIPGDHAEGQTPEYVSYWKSDFSPKGYIASRSNGAFEIGSPFTNSDSRMLNSLFTANQMRSIDRKIDDGIRPTGKVQANWGSETGTGWSCQGNASDAYSTDPFWVNTPGCYMMVLGIY